MFCSLLFHRSTWKARGSRSQLSKHLSPKPWLSESEHDAAWGAPGGAQPDPPPPAARPDPPRAATVERGRPPPEGRSPAAANSPHPALAGPPSLCGDPGQEPGPAFPRPPRPLSVSLGRESFGEPQTHDHRWDLKTPPCRHPMDSVGAQAGSFPPACRLLPATAPPSTGVGSPPASRRPAV